MSHADELKTSRNTLRALFRGELDAEAEALIEEVVRHSDPPIKVVTESTWALKFGGLVHCAVCEEHRDVRVELPSERRGLCEEHDDWTIFFQHHSWDSNERRAAVMKRLRWWLHPEPEPPVDPRPWYRTAIRYLIAPFIIARE